MKILAMDFYVFRDRNGKLYDVNISFRLFSNDLQSSAIYEFDKHQKTGNEKPNTNEPEFEGSDDIEINGGAIPVSYNKLTGHSPGVYTKANLTLLTSDDETFTIQIAVPSQTSTAQMTFVGETPDFLSSKPIHGYLQKGKSK